MVSAYQKHVQRWNSCTDCHLHKRRKHVCLARGTIPCDVLFIGEAPGQSEDVSGLPFDGPAGHLLDDEIDQARKMMEQQNLIANFTTAFSNLVCCIPLGDDGNKTAQPSTLSIKACRDRLAELIELCNPQMIVCVGTLAWQWLGGDKKDSYKTKGDVKLVQIIHPAGILRGDRASRPLTIKKTVVTLANAFEQLIPF